MNDLMDGGQRFSGGTGVDRASAGESLNTRVATLGKGNRLP